MTEDQPLKVLTSGEIERIALYNMNEDRLRELVVRSKVKEKEDGREYTVVCILVDDKAWTWFVDLLMPNHDWQAYRNRGEIPVARGVVPKKLVEEVIDRPLPEPGVVVLFGSGGWSVYGTGVVA